ncbi:MAG: peptidoglycan DD-metalloendopeptidase family protein [Bacteroidales bacterium]|jgi:murein DD-endopeptidase MepM/ murein hydrolase activator NlpD|nr:peptidoglycan DD-metalloendopeptidase family protein [Bacteroidales bacterium]
MERKIKIIIFVCIASVFLPMNKVIASSSEVNQSTIDSLLYIPSSDLYQHTWGGANTRLRTDLLNINSDYTLPLQSETESAFVFPCVNKPHVCSSYGMRNGRMHTGTDIKQNLGDSIVAAWDGVVRMANNNYYAYGGTVVIRHHNGLETLYAHLSDIVVSENQELKAGTLIGYAGRTGRATTEHLHFETRFLYEHFNPNTIIDFNTFSLKCDTLYVHKGKFTNTPPVVLIAGQDTVESPQTDSVERETTSEVAVTAPKEQLSSVQTVQQTQPSSAKSYDIYTVKQGDTLYSIAKSRNMTVDELCKINNIRKDNVLQIGQKLKLK